MVLENWSNQIQLATLGEKSLNFLVTVDLCNFDLVGIYKSAMPFYLIILEIITVFVVISMHLVTL